MQRSARENLYQLVKQIERCVSRCSFERIDANAHQTIDQVQLGEVSMRSNILGKRSINVIDIIWVRRIRGGTFAQEFKRPRDPREPAVERSVESMAGDRIYTSTETPVAVLSEPIAVAEARMEQRKARSPKTDGHLKRVLVCAGSAPSRRRVRQHRLYFGDAGTVHLGCPAFNDGPPGVHHADALSQQDSELFVALWQAPVHWVGQFVSPALAPGASTVSNDCTVSSERESEVGRSSSRASSKVSIWRWSRAYVDMSRHPKSKLPARP